MLDPEPKGVPPSDACKFATEPKRRPMDWYWWKLLMESSAIVTAVIAVLVYFSVLPDKVTLAKLTAQAAASEEATKKLTAELFETKKELRAAARELKPSPLEHLATMKVLAAPYAQRIDLLRRRKEGQLSADEYSRQYASVRGGNPKELIAIASLDENQFVTELGISREAWGTFKIGKGVEFISGQDQKGTSSHVEWFGDLLNSEK